MSVAASSKLKFNVQKTGIKPELCSKQINLNLNNQRIIIMGFEANRHKGIKLKIKKYVPRFFSCFPKFRGALALQVTIPTRYEPCGSLIT